jgi:hypothetical protein
MNVDKFDEFRQRHPEVAMGALGFGVFLPSYLSKLNESDVLLSSLLFLANVVGTRMIALRNTALATGALGAYMFGDRRWGGDFSGLAPLINKGLGDLFDGVRDGVNSATGGKKE